MATRPQGVERIKSGHHLNIRQYPVKRLLGRERLMEGTAMAQENQDYIGCSIRLLPEEKWVDAAKAAVVVNPANAPAIEAFGLGAPGQVIPPGHLALLTGKYWGSRGVTLTVGFLDATPVDLARRILSHMNAWAEWANVTFSLTKHDPQVRITRGAGGYWSNFGTDILSVAAGSPTMNLQDFTMNTRDSEFHRVVRHETGHTLGFPHEHRRKEIVSRIDKSKALAYFLATDGWDAATTTEQVLTPYPDSALNHTALTDVLSIMCYPLPGSIMTDGIAVPGGSDIDPEDAKFVATIYPVKRRPLVFMVASDGHLWTNWWDGKAWQWQNQGTPPGRSIVSGTLTTVVAEGRPLVFMLASDGHLWTNWWDGKAWQWQNQGTPPGGLNASGELATLSYDGRPSVFALGSEGHLWTNWWTGDAWQWTDLGTPPGRTIVPGTLTTPQGQPLVFMLASDGHLWTNWWDPDAKVWNWQDQGLPHAHDGLNPRRGLATVTVERRPLVFGVGIGDRLWTNWWDGQSWQWQEQGTPPDRIVIGKGLATVVADGRPLVFMLASDGHLWTNWWDGSAWQWHDQGTPPGRGIVDGTLATVVTEVRPLVFMLASDGHLWTNWWDGNAWQWQDQGTAGGHPIVSGNLTTVAVT
jgi:hypothetical protein